MRIGTQVVFWFSATFWREQGQKNLRAFIFCDFNIKIKHLYKIKLFFGILLGSSYISVPFAFFPSSIDIFGTELWGENMYICAVIFTLSNGPLFKSLFLVGGCSVHSQLIASNYSPGANQRHDRTPHEDISRNTGTNWRNDAVWRKIRDRRFLHGQDSKWVTEAWLSIWMDH